jgi:hypothetical protein
MSDEEPEDPTIISHALKTHGAPALTGHTMAHISGFTLAKEDEIIGHNDELIALGLATEGLSILSFGDTIEDVFYSEDYIPTIEKEGHFLTLFIGTYDAMTRIVRDLQTYLTDIDELQQGEQGDEEEDE